VIVGAGPETVVHPSSLISSKLETKENAPGIADAPCFFGRGE
jgi:hypothetical protein